MSCVSNIGLGYLNFDIWMIIISFSTIKTVLVLEEVCKHFSFRKDFRIIPFRCRSFSFNEKFLGKISVGKLLIRSVKNEDKFYIYNILFNERLQAITTLSYCNQKVIKLSDSEEFDVDDLGTISKILFSLGSTDLLKWIYEILDKICLCDIDELNQFANILRDKPYKLSAKCEKEFLAYPKYLCDPNAIKSYAKTFGMTSYDFLTFFRKAYIPYDIGFHVEMEEHVEKLDLMISDCLENDLVVYIKIHT